jgi:uncharacterized delta-60 repeat protein
MRFANVTALVLGVLASAGAASAAPGDLDPSFSDDGKRTVDLGGPERGEGVALRPNPATPSSIAVAGHITPDDSGESFNFALALINSTGGSAEGRTYNFSGNSDESAFGIAVQPSDQRIVMVGNTNVTAGGWGVARLDGNLTFDPGFNTIGWTTSSFPGPTGNGSVPLDVAIQDDRDIVAVGVTGANDIGDFAIARYQPTGPPDPEFSVDGDGQQTTDFSDGADQAHAVAIQPADQKIVVAGLAGPPGESDFALARYTTAGSLDPSFSAPDGKLTTDFGGVSFADDVAVQSDGKILVAGTDNAATGDFAVARYNTDGSLDTSFSCDGKQVTDFAGNVDLANGVAVQSDGRIVVAGSSFSMSTVNDFAVARYNTDGSLDTGFSGDGKQTVSFGATDVATGLVIQADGNIVLAGYTESSALNGDFAVARLEGGGGGASDPEDCGPGGGDGDDDDPGAIVPPGGAMETPLDITAPAFALGGSKAQKAGKTISVVVSATTEDLYASASGVVSVPKASRAYRLKAIANRFVAGGTKATLKLKVPSAALKAIKRALRGRRKVKASIKLTARDGAGNLTTGKRTVKLKR